MKFPKNLFQEDITYDIILIIFKKRMIFFFLKKKKQKIKFCQKDENVKPNSSERT